MIIRKLLPEDAAKYKEIRLEGVQDSPASFYSNADDVNALSIEEIQAQLDPSSQRTVLGAFDQQDLIAIVGLHRDPMAKIRHKVGFWGVYTKASHRGRGIARQLFEAALAQSRLDPEITMLTLSVHTENTSAKSLYLSLGFVSYGIQKNALRVNDTYFHEEQMALNLS